MAEEKMRLRDELPKEANKVESIRISQVPDKMFIYLTRTLSKPIAREIITVFIDCNGINYSVLGDQDLTIADKGCPQLPEKCQEEIARLYEELSKEESYVTSAWIYQVPDRTIIYLTRHFCSPIFCEKIMFTTDSPEIEYEIIGESKALGEKRALIEIFKKTLDENPDYAGKIHVGSYWGHGLP